MIEVRAHLGEGRISIEVAGHEEHVAGGRVCAAVSAVIQTALLGVQAIAEQHPDLVSVEITEE
ncbi:ribosomal-processing cysteine protease Prp [Streptomyces natalensis]|uniref:Ribosomal processing cysteine protease Prp n=1 Tax=Streptomyces natalensis ATCC 27448 TaxID=1240678 RepID=A0A0D7CKU9_9ACTN|nr:ribosomal-processing cysteine protease Prp [Streptomyces natalensis]KIZ16839.1 ribosomal protein [Streptomyces natalensis ATCC 27448]